MLCPNFDLSRRITFLYIRNLNKKNISVVPREPYETIVAPVSKTASVTKLFCVWMVESDAWKLKARDWFGWCNRSPPDSVQDPMETNEPSAERTNPMDSAIDQTFPLAGVLCQFRAKPNQP
jgi:hypothetical protein